MHDFWLKNLPHLRFIFVSTAARNNIPASAVDLTNYDMFIISAVLKKFLYELADPLIPVQWYDRFIEASSKYYRQFCIVILIVLF